MKNKILISILCFVIMILLVSVYHGKPSDDTSLNDITYNQEYLTEIGIKNVEIKSSKQLLSDQNGWMDGYSYKEFILYNPIEFDDNWKKVDFKDFKNFIKQLPDDQDTKDDILKNVNGKDVLMEYQKDEFKTFFAFYDVKNLKVKVFYNSI